jgi:hypothetical protein
MYSKKYAKVSIINKCLTHPSQQFLLLRMKTQLNLLKEKNCSALKMSECDIFVPRFLHHQSLSGVDMATWGLDKKIIFVNIWGYIGTILFLKRMLSMCLGSLKLIERCRRWYNVIDVDRMM